VTQEDTHQGVSDAELIRGACPTPAHGAGVNWTQAVDALTEAFGLPQVLPNSRRWSHVRASGAKVRVDLHEPSQELWVFDPEGRGLWGAYSLEVDSEMGQAWLKDELRRLLREP
jgi:hypothetical protein